MVKRIRFGAGSEEDPLPSLHTESVSGIADHICLTADEVETAFNNLSSGESIYIGDDNAPLNITQWLDIDVDGVQVIGPGTKTLLRTADGANVGGIRVGFNAHCEDITIRGVAHDGNYPNQTSGDSLSSIYAGDAKNVRIISNYVERQYPRHVHGTGGSGITVNQEAENVTVAYNRTDEVGDRGIEIAAQNCYIVGNRMTNGFDRGISLNLTDDLKGVGMGRANNAVVHGNVISDSIEGSAIGIHGVDGAHDRYVITNNVAFGAHRNLVRVYPHASGVTISNNIGWGYDSTQVDHGIDLKSDSSNGGKITDVTITGNQVYGYQARGIRTKDSATTNVTVTNNHVEECTQNDAEASITLNHVGGVCGFNQVLNSRNKGIDGTGTELLVIGNRIKGSYAHAMRMEGTNTNNLIAFNWAADNHNDPNNNAASFDNKDSGSMYLGNIISTDTETAAIFDSGNGNSYVNNWSPDSSAFNVSAPEYVRDNMPAIFLSSPPSATEGAEYYDDGTNTGSGTKGKRVYLGGAWVDAFTA